MGVNFLKKIPSTIFITIGLILIGLIFISISSLSEAQSSFGDKFFFVKKQIQWLVIGAGSLIFFSKIKLPWLKQLIFPAYVLSVILLVLVLIPHIGTSVLGARRWINLGFTNFQPSELFKFIAIPYFALLFSNPEKRNLKNLLINLGIPLVLIILEPNMSTTVLVAAIVFSIYYLSGGEIVSLFALTLLGVIASILLIFTSPYRQARLQTLLNPSNDQAGASYHSNQITISLASGGLIGKGIGNSSQKYQFLPQLTTDSIMAVIGEETGFIGVSFIIYLYVILIISIFRIAKFSADPFLQLLGSGVGCWIAYQTLINLGAIAAIIPLTGVPLPFISYGGSSLVTLLSSIGLVNNIDSHDKRK